MVSLWRPGNKNECFLALDVGTEAVKALVFEKKEGRYFILSAALQYFDELRPFDNDKIMLDTAEDALNRAGKSPRELLLYPPPSTLKSRVVSFELSRQKPEIVISAKEAKSIIESSSLEVQKKIAKQFSGSSGIMPQDIQFTGTKILGIQIDGYDVPNLLGYSGKKIALKVMADFLPRGHIEKYGKIFSRTGLKCRIVNPVANLGTLWQDDAIFVDIGGDITQVFLVRNGKIAAVDEFEIGGRDFSRAISQTLGMRLQEARFFKERYSRGELSEESRQRIKDILSQICAKWQSLLKSNLGSIKGAVPSTFFIFGGGSKLPEIGETAEEGKEIRFVEPKDFLDVTDNTHCVNSPQFINSLLLFYDVK